MKFFSTLHIWACMLLLMVSGWWTTPVLAQNEAELNNDFLVRCIAFYNLENLFDTIHDVMVNEDGSITDKKDFEYLPTGGMQWTSLKYEHKIHNMAYAISQLGTDVTPTGAAIVGVTEVENIGCLNDLCRELEQFDRHYKPILLEGPDRRGIDVGLLYDPKFFQPTKVVPYTLHAHYNNGNQVHSRFQLLISGRLMGASPMEKIHIIVNHWPSRLGGEEQSRATRDTAAMLCREIADSIYLTDPRSKIIIMGDLNDDPFNHSCAVIIDAKKEREEVHPKGFFNTMWKHLDNNVGTLCYQGVWSLFDQIIISEPLLTDDLESGKWFYWKSQVFNKPFLTIQEGKDKGTPLRTHKSGVWLDGYGDHYPTMIYLIKKKN